MFFEGFQIAKATIFINESVLVIIAAILFGIIDGSSNQAGCRNVLHIDLNLLSRIVCCFIPFGNVLWVGQFNSHLSSSP